MDPDPAPGPDPDAHPDPDPSPPRRGGSGPVRLLWVRLVTVCVLVGCVRGGNADWYPTGPDRFVVACGGQMSECHWGAAQACPYGYETLAADSRATGAVVTKNTVRVARQSGLQVQCLPPTFCDQTACAQGLRCVQSRRYVGRLVCSVQ